jgi:hypothetical protein
MYHDIMELFSDDALFHASPDVRLTQYVGHLDEQMMRLRNV